MSAVRVAILSVGDELVLGQIEDTNAGWLARALREIGAMPGERRTVGDDRAALSRAMRDLAATHGAVIVTGGLGPTLDDLTREALCDLVDGDDAALVEDPAGVAHLGRWFAARGRPMPVSNLRQAMRPPSARLLDNPHGTAPGLGATLQDGACELFCLPGPPNEMRPMFESFVAPRLSGDGEVVATAALHTIGLGESAVGELLGELMTRGREPSVGTTASDGIVSIRVRSTGARDAAREALEATVALCRARVGTVIFGRDGESLASVVGAMLAERGVMLATAESCTGGLLGARITDVAGSSAWYSGGFVTYENARKVADLGVREATLRDHGAVSHETAIEMARGALSRTGAGLALSTTGVAGPSGGSEAKPVGTVYIAVAERHGSVYSRRFHFPGDRGTIRSRTAHLALACARFALLGEPMRPVLWAEGEACRVERV
ncbi:MAG: competence/damage-inducible protein A [bacterium]|jgi:nicotinamide-nucleotide amidase